MTGGGSFEIYHVRLSQDVIDTHFDWLERWRLSIEATLSNTTGCPYLAC